MNFQPGEARLKDFNFFRRVRIFFIRTRWYENDDGVIRKYKLYRSRRVLIEEIHYSGFFDKIAGKKKR